MKSVSDQLLEFLRNNAGTFPSGELQRLELKNKNGTNATPRSIVRRLQEMKRKGLIYKDSGNPKHSLYSADPILPKPKPTVHFEERNGTLVAIVG